MKTPAAPLSALFVGLIVVSISPHSRAQTERDLDSHEHGQALMSLVIDGNQLILELESPWMNLIGFEHVPESDEQKQLLSSALSMLNTPASLFDLPEKADCELVDVVRHDDFGMHDEEHASHEEHTDKHDHDHESEGGHATEHSELHIEYQFNCTSIDELASLDVKLFELWPGMEDLEVQSIGPSGQGLETVTAGRSTLDLSSIN